MSLVIKFRCPIKNVVYLTSLDPCCSSLLHLHMWIMDHFNVVSSGPSLSTHRQCPPFMGRLNDETMASPPSCLLHEIINEKRTVGALFAPTWMKARYSSTWSDVTKLHGRVTSILSEGGLLLICPCPLHNGYRRWLVDARQSTLVLPKLLGWKVNHR